MAANSHSLKGTRAIKPCGSLPQIHSYARQLCACFVHLRKPRTTPGHSAGVERNVHWSATRFAFRTAKLVCFSAENNEVNPVSGGHNALSLGYGAVSLVFLAAGTVTTVLPQWVLHNPSLFVGMPAQQQMPALTLLLACGGTGFVLAAAVAYVLKDSVDHNRFTSDTYRRLNSGLKFFALTVLGAQMASMPIIKPTLLWSVLGALLPTVLISTRLHWMMGGGAIHETALGVWKALHDMPSFKSPASAWYSLTAATGCVLAPWLLLTGESPLFPGVDLGACGALAVRLVGAMLLVAAAVLFVLKSAADRGRIGASTFRALNAAMIAASAIQAYWLVVLRSEPTNQLMWAALVLLSGLGPIVYAQQLLSKGA